MILRFSDSNPDFFFNDTATTEIYTLSLHDALPIWRQPSCRSPRCLPPRDASHHVAPFAQPRQQHRVHVDPLEHVREDRKSTRLNSSHANISYAVFCLKKKKRS